MINLERIEGKNIYTFKLSGKIDKKDVEDFYLLLEKESKEKQELKVLGIIDDFPGFDSLSTFVQVFKLKIKGLANISKYAVLSEREWLQTLMPIGNFVTPGIPIKHFNLDEKNEAVAWLAKDEPTRSSSQDVHPPEVNISKIEDSSVYEFTVDSTMNEAEISMLYTIIKDKSRYGKIKLLGSYTKFDGFESVKAFFDVIKIDFAAFAYIEKFAILTDEAWGINQATIENKILPFIAMKVFVQSDRELAINWLKE